MTNSNNPKHFSGMELELAIGSTFATRYWNFFPNQGLMSLAETYFWNQNENRAECRAPEKDFGWSPWSLKVFKGEGHRAPEDDCTCGFYAYSVDGDDNYWLTTLAGFVGSVRVFGVIECYGKCLIGARGLRAEKARVRALLTDHEEIKERFPKVSFFTDKDAMLSNFDIIQAPAA